MNPFPEKETAPDAPPQPAGAGGDSCPGPEPILGYCTNVHAGSTWEGIRAELERHAVGVRRRLGMVDALPVGLWLPAPVARALLGSRRVAEVRGFLADSGLLPYTLNGFPHGDFHQDVVKHAVYRPDWSEPRRLAYTQDLVAVLDGILPPGHAGSISTLPLFWGSPPPGPEALRAACRNLLAAARQLQELEERGGRLIHLDLEPEPGCVLQRSADVVRFFVELLLPAAQGLDVRRYLRVCHDVCHAAVMFEEQSEALRRYDEAGIRVGKVQVSSALRADFDSMDRAQRAAALRELGEFREERYLHQTMVRRPGGVTSWHDDLPRALDAVREGEEPQGEWRVHFHMPIHLDRAGHLQTTRDEIPSACALLRARGVEHWEVETYAWNVLPRRLQPRSLAEGIAAELTWLRGVAAWPVAGTA
jgi:sugar phosphate isomerase/epimerase